MKEVLFKYDLDQRVVTPFGDAGLIQMLGYDDAKEQYFVKTKDNSQWYKEDQIKAAE